MMPGSNCYLKRTEKLIRGKKAAVPGRYSFSKL
jgi:hypothetical protein